MFIFSFFFGREGEGSVPGRRNNTQVTLRGGHESHGGSIINSFGFHCLSVHKMLYKLLTNFNVILLKSFP